MKIIITLLLMSISLPVYSVGHHSVRGYVKRDGTYVKSHRQTNPNKTQRDNWSSKPNINPYTGKHGSKEPRR